MEIYKYIRKQTTLFDFAHTELVDGISDEQTFYSVVREGYSFTQAIEILDKIDWSFKDFRTQYLTHKFHPYPARFIPQIPYVFIKLFTKQGDWVLDPFCGCGTTNVEALLNNRNSIGNDLNPLAVLITKAKTTLLTDEEFAILDYAVERIMRNIKNPSYEEAEKIMENLPRRNTSKYFTRDVVAKLLVIKNEIVDIENKGHINVSTVLKVALSATIWSITESKGRSSPEVFFNKVKLMKDELRRMKEFIKFKPPITKIIEGDARFLKQIDDKSIDLIVTSPPYVNALDYYRIHMHNMFWLGIDFKEFKRYEIGSHSHFISNRFRLLSEYLGDMLRSMIEMNRVLKDNKLAVIVVGNSTIEYELIESWKFFVNMAETIGFRKLRVYHRPIDVTKKYTSKDIGNINDEYIVVFQKIDESPVTAFDDDFIAKVVTNELEKFLEIVKKSPGSAVHLSRRKPTKERLMKNIVKLQEAIKNVKKDIRIEK